MVETSKDTPRKGILAWWASNSVAANLLMVIAFVGGIVGYSTLQREAFPSGSFPGATVSVAWPGASPQEVEEQIILRIEEAVADLEGIEELTATASEGSGWVNIQGTRDRDIGEFVSEIELRVNSINNLPRDAFRPVVNRWVQEQQSFMMAVYGDIDRRELQRIAEEIRDEVASTVPEAQLVYTQSRLPEEVSIELSETAMRRYNLTFNEVAAAIRNSSLNASAGSVRTDQGDMQLAARQLADTADDFNEIIVRQTREGGTIRLRDVATVTDGLVDRNFSGTFDGEEMVLIDVRTSGSVDVVSLSEQMTDFMEEKREELPSTVKLAEWFNSADIYESRMTTITNSALVGLALVLAVPVLILVAVEHIRQVVKVQISPTTLEQVLMHQLVGVVGCAVVIHIAIVHIGPAVAVEIGRDI